MGRVSAGLGLGGEGWTTMTITTPTGEGSDQRAHLRASASLRVGGCVSHRLIPAPQTVYKGEKEMAHDEQRWLTPRLQKAAELW
ncbi:ethanolamine utilization protein [Citrobacter koseri]|uniref:Ethanolamine utilization protein n=1 Tax=Citrobacter koseri TaxID=545 RepID=A0A2X2VC02_CITKO|nr:ethanolamine utilization protein [Citrobacter koseri]